MLANVSWRSLAVLHQQEKWRLASQMMDGLTITLMLSAAFAHASWHALIKNGIDQRVALVGMHIAVVAVAVWIIPFVSLPHLAVWPVIIGSVALHVGYKFALASTYAIGDLSQAYPLARGFVPLFGTAIAFLLLAQSPTPGQMIGILIVSVGLAWLAAYSLHKGLDARVIFTALLAGLLVAAYSVVDAYGVRLAGDWASFTVWLIVIDALSFVALVTALNRRTMWLIVWRERWKMVASGSLGIASFTIFIWALSRSPVGPVLALRESSVLLATTIGIVVYREPMSKHKVGGACLIAIGLMLIGIFR